MANMTHDTHTRRILDVIRRAPGLSAHDISVVLELPKGSVSSRLNRMTKDGVVDRIDQCGPRGGYGYFAANKPRREVLDVPMLLRRKFVYLDAEP